MSKPQLEAPTARVLYWFRTDLRLHDSPALTAALGLENIQAFYPVSYTVSSRDREVSNSLMFRTQVWCFDPQYVWKHKVGVNR